MRLGTLTEEEMGAAENRLEEMMEELQNSIQNRPTNSVDKVEIDKNTKIEKYNIHKA